MRRLRNLKEIRMYTILFFIYLGGTTLPFVKCFSDGNFDANQDVCQSMAVDHDGEPYQDPASNPFTVTPDYVDVTVSGTVVTGTTSTKSDLSVCKPGSDWFLIMLLASYLSLVEGFPFLMKHRKLRNVVVMQVSSVLSLLFSLVAFIISLILTELIAAKVLTGLAVFLSLCQVIVIFSFCGPSHEL
ncbi:hypothetical protein MHYP_G00324460 [Metynnis hypsauchen]